MEIKMKMQKIMLCTNFISENIKVLMNSEYIVTYVIIVGEDLKCYANPKYKIKVSIRVTK